MNEPKQKVISIKRSDESVDGRLISYLQSNPFNDEQSFPELVLFTLKAYWLPLVLFDEGLRGEKMRKIGIQAINKLEAQISNIRQICGIDAHPVYVTPIVNHQISTATPIDKISTERDISDSHSNNSSQSNAQTNEDEIDEDDDDDDWDVEAALMRMPKPEELRDANRMMGLG